MPRWFVADDVHVLRVDLSADGAAHYLFSDSASAQSFFRRVAHGHRAEHYALSAACVAAGSESGMVSQPLM
jgi:hypothetical protein